MSNTKLARQRVVRNPLIFVLGLAALLCSSLARATPDLTDYDLVFSDEFESSTLDASKWNTSFLWGPFHAINGEEQYYVDALDLDSNFGHSPFSLANGILTIEAVETSSVLQAPEQPAESDPYWATNPDRNFQESYDPADRRYLSGIITSSDSYNATHGYFEARLKFPEGQGLWPAFWLLNTKYVENLPEIDIVEFLGHKKNTVHHTLHYMDVTDGWRVVSSPTYETTGQDYSADFHTYGLAWDPKKIRFYVDGELVREVTDNDFLVSTQSMYILLNLAVGGRWPGSPDASTVFPAKYEIDYVRAYERKSHNTITPQVLASDYQLMFSDEFNGTSVNEDLWNTAFLWGPYYQINNEDQIYLDKHGIHRNYPVDPFEVSGGTLKIRAEQLAEADRPPMPHKDDAVWDSHPRSYRKETNYGEEDGFNPNYTSGILTSYDSFKFVNGYAEARVKMPAGSGLWPAFWLLNGYYVGPMPEMDIVEAKGESTGVTHHTYHYFNNIGQLISDPDTYNLSGSGIDDFHVYGFQWDTDRLVWYVDGIPVKEIVGPHVSTQLSYIIMNLAVGGNFVADVDDAGIPAEMEVDWVRVWQIEGGDEVVVEPEPEVDENVVALGDLGRGIAIDDDAVGGGFIMFSVEHVFSRFPTNEPNQFNADHLIAVRYRGGRWEYNDNTNWIAFELQAGDRLLAQVNFTTDVVSMLEGQSGLFEGIRWGFASGNITFTMNQFAGMANAGEIGVHGTRITVSETESSEEIELEKDSSDLVYIGSLNRGIAVSDNAQGDGFIMYSVKSVFSRFLASQPNRFNADHLVAVRNRGGTWEYNNNTDWIAFEAQSDDRLLARVNFTTDVVSELEGQSGLYEGVRWGYDSGDISFTMNQFAGAANAGEIDVDGRKINISETETNDEIVIESSNSGAVSVGALNRGIAVSDNAQGMGFIMYSSERVFNRFSTSEPNRFNAEHLIAVRYQDGMWEYNNNNDWIRFQIATTDRLLAQVNFSTDEITSLEAQSGSYEGVSSGYISGNLIFTMNQFARAYNPGEIGVAGNAFNY